jgi:hypothetical protein
VSVKDEVRMTNEAGGEEALQIRDVYPAPGQRPRGEGEADRVAAELDRQLAIKQSVQIVDAGVEVLAAKENLHPRAPGVVGGAHRVEALHLRAPAHQRRRVRHLVQRVLQDRSDDLGIEQLGQLKPGKEGSRHVRTPGRSDEQRPVSVQRAVRATDAGWE